MLLTGAIRRKGDTVLMCCEFMNCFVFENDELDNSKLVKSINKLLTFWCPSYIFSVSVSIYCCTFERILPLTFDKKKPEMVIIGIREEVYTD